MIVGQIKEEVKCGGGTGSEEPANRRERERDAEAEGLEKKRFEGCYIHLILKACSIFKTK